MHLAAYRHAEAGRGAAGVRGGLDADGRLGGGADLALEKEEPADCDGLKRLRMKDLTGMNASIRNSKKIQKQGLTYPRSSDILYLVRGVIAQLVRVSR